MLCFGGDGAEVKISCFGVDGTALRYFMLLLGDTSVGAT